MRFDIITIFPEMFAALNYGVVGRALKYGLITANYINPRQYSARAYGNVDDRPYGGGPGMVMMIEPLRRAIEEAKVLGNDNVGGHHDQQGAQQFSPHVVHLSPQGKLLDQRGVEELASKRHLIMLVGRYEGIDERLIESEVDSEWSIGDYVLSGGELAAMTVIDAVTRILPGVLGDAESAQQDSFTSGLLDFPHYTKPDFIQGMEVPELLRGGDHKAIARWRLKQALGRTWLRRPDLLRKRKLKDDEQLLLNEFIREISAKNKE